MGYFWKGIKQANDARAIEGELASLNGVFEKLRRKNEEKLEVYRKNEEQIISNEEPNSEKLKQRLGELQKRKEMLQEKENRAKKMEEKLNYGKRALNDLMNQLSQAKNQLASLRASQGNTSSNNIGQKIQNGKVLSDPVKFKESGVQGLKEPKVPISFKETINPNNLCFGTAIKPKEPVSIPSSFKESEETKKIFQKVDAFFQQLPMKSSYFDSESKWAFSSFSNDVVSPPMNYRESSLTKTSNEIYQKMTKSTLQMGFSSTLDSHFRPSSIHFPSLVQNGLSATKELKERSLNAPLSRGRDSWTESKSFSQTQRSSSLNQVHCQFSLPKYERPISRENTHPLGRAETPMSQESSFRNGTSALLFRPRELSSSPLSFLEFDKRNENIAKRLIQTSFSPLRLSHSGFLNEIPKEYSLSPTMRTEDKRLLARDHNPLSQSAFFGKKDPKIQEIKVSSFDVMGQLLQVTQENFRNFRLGCLTHTENLYTDRNLRILCTQSKSIGAPGIIDYSLRILNNSTKKMEIKRLFSNDQGVQILIKSGSGQKRNEALWELRPKETVEVFGRVDYSSDQFPRARCASLIYELKEELSIPVSAFLYFPVNVFLIFEMKPQMRQKEKERLSKTRRIYELSKGHRRFCGKKIDQEIQKTQGSPFQWQDEIIFLESSVQNERLTVQVSSPNHHNTTHQMNLSLSLVDFLNDLFANELDAE